ncbi:MAG: cobalamin B12-binding domain-containing protein, partial [Planctomycetes bacterium]|nr:cobalamin B12-binding domain-containing protein [Planctomycetota bacterium]
VTENLIRPALERIGAGWDQGRVALSQIYMSGRICEELMAAMLPAAGTDRKDQPRIAIAVLEDHHRLGSRIVLSVLRASGFEILDFGHGVKADHLAQRVVAEGVSILLISALMLPSALKVKDVRYRLQELGADVRMVVGGAPFLFDAQLWQEVGADVMGRNAGEAVEIVARMTGGVS